MRISECGLRSSGIRSGMPGNIARPCLSLLPHDLFADDFKRALPGRTFSFPQDHFSHPEFKTEWWYYSGHLYNQEKKSYGYQLTFFRTALRRETKGKIEMVDPKPLLCPSRSDR